MDPSIFDACETDNVCVVRECIAQGVDMNAPHTEDGWTPLHLAVLSESVNVMRFLVSEGVDINKRDDDMSNALHYACDTFHPKDEIIRFLVMSGVDIEAEDDVERTPLLVMYQLEAFFKRQISKNTIFLEECETILHEVRHLNEWRPINAANFPLRYRRAMRTLLLLAKSEK